MAKRIVWIIVLLVAAAAIWRVMSVSPVAVDVATVGRGSIRSFFEEEGKTRVVERFVVSSPVGGRLMRVALEEGDRVEKGALVAEIDPLPLRSQIEETEAQMRALRHRLEGVERKKPKQEELARAALNERLAAESLLVSKRDLEEALATLDVARKEASRERSLSRSQAGALSELDVREAEETRAAARVSALELRVKIRGLQIEAEKLNTAILREQLQDFEWQKKDYHEQIAALSAKLQSVRDDLKHTRIDAPTTGVVLNLFEESQRMLTAGAPILEIGQLSHLEVEAEFLSEDAAHMKPGMPAEIFGRALSDQVVAAKVKRIYPSAFKKISSLGVEQQRVKVIVDYKEATIGDRYRVEVRVIIDQREDAILVPEGALFRHQGAWHAFRVSGDAAELRPLTLGLRDGRMREVLEGLDVGDRVILHPDAALEAGAIVESLR